MSAGDPFARALAKNVQIGHGIDQATTLDMSEEIGAPRGYIPTYNVALDRALGAPGIPLGRITEISGWEAAGKSTVLDQILAAVQAENGVGALADVERTRDRPYMTALGVRPESLVWLGGRTAEQMFAEVETLVRTSAHLNALAWQRALAGVRGIACVPCATYKYEIVDPPATPKGKPRPVAAYQFARWGREQAAALLEWQKAQGIAPTSVRDAASREALRPVVIHGDDEAERKAALRAWMAGEDHPLAQPADRPIVVGWDSVAGTPTEEELEGDSRDQHVASAAKVIRRNLRRLVQLIDDEAIAFVVVNQRYEKINMGFGRSFGPTSDTYGGGGLKYHSTIRVELDKVGDILPPGSNPDTRPAPMGQIVKITVRKNKVGSPNRIEEFGLIYGRGADNAWALYEDLKKRGVIKVAGGWSKFTDPTILKGEDKAFHGWTDLSNMLAERPTLWPILRGIYHQGRS
jgi:RecA/RadA recombinase